MDIFPGLAHKVIYMLECFQLTHSVYYGTNKQNAINSTFGKNLYDVCPKVKKTSL